MEEVIYFEADSYELNKEEESSVSKILHNIKEYEVKQIYLSGHTDSDGNTDYNYQLSEKRVHTIRDLFTKAGFRIAENNINYEGELNPKLSNNSDVNKQKNRRVEILIIYDETKTTFYEDATIQHYKFSTFEGIKLIGKNGTKIKIKPNSIADSEGKEIKGQVKLQLKEYYLNSEIILSGLQTLSIEDSLLETAGMIHIKVYHNDVEVNLKKGTTFEIEMPNKKRLKAMDFYDKEDHETKWTKATTWVWEPHMKDDILEKFVFNSPKFGWINCDRFLDFEALTNINVQVNDTIDTRVCIVFKSLNSILNSSKETNGFKFEKIPEDAKISIIAFKLKGENYLFAQKDVSIKRNSSYHLDLKEVPKDLFNKLIEQFN